MTRLDSIFGVDESYYPQASLKERKYVEKKWLDRYITDDLEISSDDSDEEWLEVKY